MAYGHQVDTKELATSILGVVNVDSAIPIVFGTAPINMVDKTNVNKLEILYSYTEAVERFGFAKANAETGLYDFTLSEAIDVFFSKFKVAPVIFVNVLDPAKHKTSVTDENVVITKGKGVLSKLGVLKDTVTATGATDTNLIFNEDGYLVITSATDATLKVSYDYLDPGKVTKADIIGGVDTELNKTGLELVDDIFPTFRKIVANILAPKYSSDSAVASVMKTKSKEITGLFKGQALIDIPTDTVKKYSIAAQWLNDNNVIDPHMQAYWPMLSLGGTKYHMSLQAAALMASTDSQYNDMPYKSPSNESYQCDSAVLIDGTEIKLGIQEANEQLNANGICTAINFIGGWKAWGNNTTAYPSITDVKDRFIANRRMSNWMQNTCITTLWQEIDDPLNRRQIEQAQDTINAWLNGLQGQEAILGGRFEFLKSENSTTSLLDGKTQYHLSYATPTPNEHISITFEYDPSYFENLFN